VIPGMPWDSSVSGNVPGPGINVHEPIFPMDVHQGEPFSATLLVRKSNTKLVNVPVYRLSPFGVEIDLTSRGDEFLQVGSDVDLSINFARQKIYFSGLTVAKIHLENNRKLIGFRWGSLSKVGDLKEEKRSEARFLGGQNFLLTGVAPNPALFNDLVYFDVVDVSKGGMQLATSTRNKSLIPGMVLESVISFPAIGRLTIRFKIVNIRIRSKNGENSLALGTQIIHSTGNGPETFGQYLLQFGIPVSVRDLRKEGFRVRSTQSAVDFSFVRARSEYNEVLDLRKLAYSEAGKFDESEPSAKMGDVFDAKSKILIARHRGKVVGSLRITFHAPEEKNEYQQYVELPKTFPGNDEMVVLSRICTHPEYRGSDLLYGLMKQCLLTVLQSKKRYLLGGASDALIPLYVKLGFRRQHIFFRHGALNETKEEIILADAFKILSGTDISASVWNEHYSDLTNYNSLNGDIPWTSAMKLRVKSYRALACFKRMFKKADRVNGLFKKC
jgi:predicted GNAT family N-acyltransferase